jgi:hypothetical protein
MSRIGDNGTGDFRRAQWVLNGTEGAPWVDVEQVGNGSGDVEEVFRASGVANTGVEPPAAQAGAALHPDQVDVAVQQVHRGSATRWAGQPGATPKVCVGVEHHVLASGVSGTAPAASSRSWVACWSASRWA